MQRTIVINGKKVKPGQNVSINLEVARLPSHTMIDLPIYVYRSEREGPVLLLTAGLHGDEINGVETIRRLTVEKSIIPETGTVIAIPVVNIYGFIHMSRKFMDGKDLNRSFPGHSKGALASRVAKTFFDEIVSKCDLGIDLHTASIHKDNLPQVRTNINNEYTLRLAYAFEAPVILHSELRDGSLRAVAQDKGIPILLYEAGEALRLDEKSIKIGVKGIINVLRANEMLPVRIKKSSRIKPVLTKNSKWIRAHESGMIQTIRQLGDVVEEGDIIARIHSLFDDQSYEVTAPFDGIIIGKTQIPLIHEGDAAFHIAALKDIQIAEERMEPFHQDETLMEIPMVDERIV